MDPQNENKWYDMISGKCRPDVFLCSYGFPWKFTVIVGILTEFIDYKSKIYKMY